MKIDCSRRNLLRALPAAAIAPAALPLLGRAATCGETAPMARSASEDRGVWIHPERYFTTTDAAAGRSQVRAMVQRYADAGFNLLLPWTLSGYLLAVEDPRLRAQHPSANWDALSVIIEEADQAGLKVDMWYSFTEYRGPASPEFDPAYGGDPAWRAINSEKMLTGKDEGDGAWEVCAQHAGARRWQHALLMRALKRYPKLRGLHIEEPGYDSKDYCLCPLCSRLFNEIHEMSLTDHLQSQQAQDMKTIGNSAFAWELREELNQNAPNIVYSMNGSYDWRHDRARGRDWGRWAISGWIDSFVPQVYEEDVDAFRKHLRITLDDIGSVCPVHAGIGLAWSEGKNEIGTVLRQIDAARQMGAAGIVLFHGAAFSDDDLKALKQGPFRSSAA